MNNFTLGASGAMNVVPPLPLCSVEDRRSKEGGGAFDVFDKSRRRLTAKLSLGRSEAKELERRVIQQQQQQLPQLQQQQQQQQHSTRIGSIEELLRGDASRREEKSGGALHKAKKHFKTLISGTKRVEKSITQLLLFSF